MNTTPTALVTWSHRGDDGTPWVLYLTDAGTLTVTATAFRPNGGRGSHVQVRATYVVSSGAPVPVGAWHTWGRRPGGARVTNKAAAAWANDLAGAHAAKFLEHRPELAAIAFRIATGTAWAVYLDALEHAERTRNVQLGARTSAAPTRALAI